MRRMLRAVRIAIVTRIKVGVCDRALGQMHKGIKRIKPHRPLQVLDCSFTLAGIDTQPAAPLPSHCQIWVKTEGMVNESEASLDIAADVSQRVPAPTKCYRSVSSQMRRTSR